MIPGSVRSPEEGNGNPTPVFLPGKSHGQRSLAGYSLWGHKRVGCDLETKQHTNNIQFKWSKHSNYKVEIVRMYKKARSNYSCHKQYFFCFLTFLIRRKRLTFLNSSWKRFHSQNFVLLSNFNVTNKPNVFNSLKQIYI